MKEVWATILATAQLCFDVPTLDRSARPPRQRVRFTCPHNL